MILQSCHRFRSNEVRLCLSVIAYNLRKLWQRLLLDQVAAGAGEDGRPRDQARAVPLALVDGEPSDTAAAWSHAGWDCGPTLSSGVGEPPTGSDFSDERGGEEEVSETSVGESTT